MNSRGWKVYEPYSDLLPQEKPELAAFVGNKLKETGLSD